MIRNELVTVSIGGVSAYPLDLLLVAGVNKGYNTISFNGKNLDGAVGDTVIVNINGYTFSFILVSKRYKTKDDIYIVCNGLPFTLDNVSKSDDNISYQDSDALIEGERGTIVVSNQIPNIPLSSIVYTKSSTPMNRIVDMVNVVGGEVYEINGTLYLIEQKSIPSSPTIAHAFSDEEVFDFEYSDEIENSVLLKEVLINPITDDIYSEPSITVEYDEEVGIANVFFNPSLSLGNSYSFLGLIPRPVTLMNKTDTILIDGETYINTIGGIDSVLFIKLNGEPLEDYTMYSGYNVIKFDNALYGEIEIGYTTKQILCYVSSNTTFSIKYNCVISGGSIEVNESSLISNDCKVNISTPFTYEDGGDVTCLKDTDLSLVFVEEAISTNLNVISDSVHAGGGSLKVSYISTEATWSDTTFMTNITSAVVSTIETTSGEIVYNDDLLEYIVYLPLSPLSINTIVFGSVNITGYTYVSATIPYISFQASDLGKKVDISMNVEVVEITVPTPTAGHKARFIDAVGCGGVMSREITTSGDAMCNIPATFKVDVASEFDVEISTIQGLTVVGDNGLGDLVIDYFGKVEVTLTGANLYTLDCSNIKTNGRITLDARGVV